MKLRVLRHSLHGRHAAGFLLGGLAGFAAAAGTLLASAVPFPNPAVSVDVIAALFLMWTVGWMSGPVFVGAGDEVLRPEHFALLPMSPRRLATGLLGAALVGVPGCATLIAFTGLVLYAGRLGTGPVLVAAVAVLLQLIFVVLLSQVVVAALGAVLRTRRGQDLGILLTAAACLSGLSLRYLIEKVGPVLLEHRSAPLSTALRALPSGWGAVAVDAAARAAWPLTVAALGGLTVLSVLLLAIWARLLVRRTTNAVITRQPMSGTWRRHRMRRWLARTPTGSVAAKELTIWWRDPHRRVTLGSTMVVGAVLAMMPTTSGDTPLTSYAGVLVAGFACLHAGNLYGLDGSALRHTLLIPGAERADVRGRQLAWLLIVTPVAAVLAGALPALNADPRAYPLVLGLVPALLGCGAGLCAVFSVFAAVPVDGHRSGNPITAVTNPGCLRGLLQLAMGVVLVIVAVPILAVVWLGTHLHAPALRWTAVPVGVVVGLLLTWWCGRLAYRRLLTHGPELLNLVARQD